MLQLMVSTIDDRAHNIAGERQEIGVFVDENGLEPSLEHMSGKLGSGLALQHLRLPRTIMSSPSALPRANKPVCFIASPLFRPRNCTRTMNQ